MILRSLCRGHAFLVLLYSNRYSTLRSKSADCRNCNSTVTCSIHVQKVHYYASGIGSIVIEGYFIVILMYLVCCVQYRIPYTLSVVFYLSSSYMSRMRTLYKYTRRGSISPYGQLVGLGRFAQGSKHVPEHGHLLDTLPESAEEGLACWSYDSLV